MSSPVLYTFGGSVWAAAAELAATELFPEGAIEFKTVNLVEGENFNPAFVAINPKATLPTLVAEGKVYASTADVIAYFVKTSATKVSPASELTTLVHEDKYDPNFALLLTRNEEERKAKSANLPGTFAANRQAALEKYSKTPEAASFKAFYDEKLVGNGGLVAIYKGEAPEDVQKGFFAQSQAHFANVSTLLYDILPGSLPVTGFIGGEIPGEDDYHVEAWLTRISATVGAESGETALAAFEKAFGKPVPEKVAAYWNAWIARASWKKVYAGGLH